MTFAKLSNKSDFMQHLAAFIKKDLIHERKARDHQVQNNVNAERHIRQNGRAKQRN